MKFLNSSDTKKLLESVDVVLFDIDGVLLHVDTVLPGAQAFVSNLRKLGKKISFVSNLAIIPHDIFLSRLQVFDATNDEIVNPNTSAIAYLKNINFKKDIYVIGSNVLKNTLRNEGYKVIEYKDIEPEPIEENISAVKKLSIKALEICKNVGAILVDFDIHSCMGAIQIAQFLLNNMNDLELLCGAGDDINPLDKNFSVIGPKYYIDVIERLGNRTCIQLAKPGSMLGDLLITKLNISDPNRVLFIGDNVFSDIAFGVNSGFQTLLMLTGITNRCEIEKWQFPDEYKPDYIAENFNIFANISYIM